MKLKNVRAGVRVQFKGNCDAIPYGAVGIVVRDDDIPECWDVSWDNRDDLYTRGGKFNVPTGSIFGVDIKDLRKVK